MVKQTFRDVFKTKTRDEWTRVFGELDACVEPVMDLEEVSKDDHLVQRGMWPSVEVPVSASSDSVDGIGGSGRSASSDSVDDIGGSCHSASSDPADHSGSGESGTIRITQMGCPMHLSACPPRYDHAGYPEGYHTEQILQSLGYTPEEIAGMT